MNGILDTAISLILVFLIFSVIAYIIQEMISVNLKFRGNMLWKSMAQLLDDFHFTGWRKLTGNIRKKIFKGVPDPTANTKVQLTDLFYAHPQIQSLMKEKLRLPSYIPAANFALAVLDLVAQKAPAGNYTDQLAKVKAGLQTFSAANGNVGKIIEDLVNTSVNMQDLQQRLENWFDNYMKRVSGWYESHVLLSLRIIAVIIAIGFNLNVIKLARVIYNNADIRASMVAIATDVVDNPEKINQFLDTGFNKRKTAIDLDYTTKLKGVDSASPRFDTLQYQWAADLDSNASRYLHARRTQIDSLLSVVRETGLPIGWSAAVFKADLQGKDWGLKLFMALLGWLITAGCISMGAPFWFDLLMRLVNVRRAGTKPAERERAG
jgi:hypothetical protein